jgi:hypothetical protein
METVADFPPHWVTMDVSYPGGTVPAQVAELVTLAEEVRGDLEEGRTSRAIRGVAWVPGALILEPVGEAIQETQLLY